MEEPYSEVPYLTLIGYWSDDTKKARFIHPAKLAGFGWEPENKRAMLAYLRKGVRIRAFLGYSWCRITGKSGDYMPEMGSAEFSDGRFVWPEALAYYLENFDIELPLDFLNHAADSLFQIDHEQISADKLGCMKVDSIFWETWGHFREKY